MNQFCSFTRNSILGVFALRNNEFIPDPKTFTYYEPVESEHASHWARRQTRCEEKREDIEPTNANALEGVRNETMGVYALRDGGI
jgi:hypothetical protein